MLKKCSQLLIALLAACVLPVKSAHALESLNGIALVNTDDGLRVTLALSAPVKYYVSSLHNPERLVVDLLDTRLHTRIASVPLANTPVKKLRSGIRKGDNLRLVFELSGPMSSRSDLVATQLAINLKTTGSQKSAQVAASEPPAPPKPVKVADEGGQRDVIIAIDAGHGGDDPGAIGAGRLQEKHVALAIARELAALFERERGYKPVLTRKGDYFLPLKTRRDLARKAQADLMVSIHADSFADKSA
ncbi:MAG TPA: N-acetylmuramoyl-L-alanine amidase, partial [Spongiibacteraceae bacterium]|nr:N-acetylmuramoyl-L-alanine amidase [Spongiibacteraceae bacterium]